VVVTKNQIADARRHLGLGLATAREASGRSQSDLAHRINYSRSTIASVETGAGKASRTFWTTCDQELGCQGDLIAEYDGLQDLIVRYRRQVQQDERFQRARQRAADHNESPADEPTSLMSPGGQISDGSLKAGQKDREVSLVPACQLIGLDAQPGGDLARAISSILRQAPGDLRIDQTVSAPGGRYFPGVPIDVEVYPAVDDGRILTTIPRDGAGRRWRLPLQRRLVAGRVISADGDGLFALDARQASRRLVEIGDHARLTIPRVYRLDGITTAVLWAVANLDQALLIDDARLEASRGAAAEYNSLPRSAVSGDIGQDLNIVSRLWLGSAFCADHITRHSADLSEVPTFWTREQHGEEASTWLLFGHKLDYLCTTAARYAGSAERATRMFCIPPAAVTTSSQSERILLLLAVALMESFGIEVAVTDEPDYGALPGLVLTSQRAIVATWIRADGVWHVDVTDRRGALAEYRDATGHVHAHSVTAADTPGSRLRALADYLDLDWMRLRDRCAELGEYGLAAIAEPRSRLLCLDGVDRACRFVGALP
jgi:DNA-binding XRE family transcriptional regulator